MKKAKTKLWVWGFFWLYLVSCLIMIKSLPVLTGNLVDSDDYMRMVRVFDLLNGQPDYDFVQPRMGLGEGAGVAWSLLLDIPLAGLVKLFSVFVTKAEASLITATVYPLILLFVFVISLSWIGKYAPENNAKSWVPFALILLWAPLTQFFPGRVDHHAWQLIIFVLTLGCLFQLYKHPERKKAAWEAGALMALAWSIGAEAVPWVALFTVAFGLLWVFRGKDYLGTCRRYGFALFAGTVLFLPLSRSPVGYFLVECDAISAVYITFGAAVALVWLVIGLFPQKLTSTPVKRFLAAVIVGGIAGVVLLSLFPQCITQPYGPTSPELDRIWLSLINEARPALSFAGEQPLLLFFYIGPIVLAFLVTLFHFFKDKDHRLLWGILLWLLTGALVLSFWQMRTAYLGQVFAVYPLAWLLAAVIDGYIRLAGKGGSRRRLAGAGALFGIGLVLFSLALLTPKDDQMSSVVHDIIPSCNLQAAAQELNKLPGQQVIAAYAVDGAEILFRSPHKALAATYHRNGDGILAAHNILMATDDAAARQLIARYEVDFLLVCEEHLPYWEEIAQGGNSLAHRLWQNDVPDWAMEFHRADDYALYIVQP